MGYWLAGAADAGSVPQDFVKRFDPRFWTVNFPRPAMAAVTTTAADALRVDMVFLTAGDLAGLIWESADRHDHPLTSYATRRDYRGCTLRFRWRATGAVQPLDAVDGPVLTIEGRDAAGAARAWYVRLWNYAVGVGDDAVVTLDFDSVQAGFGLPGAAVFAGDIDRMFISLVPPGYAGGSAVPLAGAAEAVVFVEDIVCAGPGSSIPVGDVMVPPHGLRMAGGYDDSYNLTPERLLRNVVALGYRGTFNHYLGMSHWFALAWDTGEARFVTGPGVNAAARAWHADFAARLKALDFELILSLSFELFDAHAPESWKQRGWDGRPALTGWVPPSTLLSPANADAVAYLRDVALSFCGIAAAAGLRVRFQIGEPWWWTGFGADRTPCFYDAAATAAFTAETGLPVPVAMTHALDAPTAAQGVYLDWLGSTLAAATGQLAAAVKAAYPGAVTYLLFYAPQVLEAAHLARVNMPGGWARPAFDVLQLEDYDFVIAGDAAASKRAVAAVTDGLGYPAAEQHYFSGFVLRPEDRALWAGIDAAAQAAVARGVAEVFVWAAPQVLRDGYTHFDLAGGEAVQAFHDVRFPVAVGLGASVAPVFSTLVAAGASGHEQRNAQWADARLEFDAGLGVRSEDELAEVIAFFRARRGRAAAFRFRDPSDDSSNGMTGVPGPEDQLLGTGDGVRTRFALVKRYGDGVDAQMRAITRPEAGTVRVAVGGTEAVAGWTLDGGAVDFDVAPAAGAAVTAGFRFDVPVRFAEDRLEVSLARFRAGEMVSVPMIEVRD